MQQEKDMPEARFADRGLVIFDFDGTVADTTPAVMRVAKASLERYGIPYTESQLRCLVGPPLLQGVKTAFGLDDELAEQVWATYRELFSQLVRPEDYPYVNGMDVLIRDLRAQGRRTAIATSRRQGSVDEMAAELGLCDQMDAIVGYQVPVRATKADSIREVLARLGAEPGDAVMVGDRFHDVNGAHEVGMACIGLYTGGAEPGEHEAAGADAVAQDVAELRRLLGV